MTSCICNPERPNKLAHLPNCPEFVGTFPRARKALSDRQKTLRCYIVACRSAKHAEAMQYCIEHGYATDPADFDARVREVEEGF